MMMMNSQQQPPPPQQKQLVVVVEGTAALGPAWPLLLTEYIEKIVRNFCGYNVNGQKHTTATGEMALVVYNSHGSQNGCILQQSGWTSSIDVFFRWLSRISFMGGGFGDAAVAEGLAEALLMCCPGPTVTQVSQGREVHKHIVLVAASNPHRIPTPVPSPPSSNNNGDLQAEHWWLADADTVAQAFPMCSVSLSVVAPRQLPLLRNIFSQFQSPALFGLRRDIYVRFNKVFLKLANPGAVLPRAKRSGRAAEPATEPPKQYAHHLLLLSESFGEARAALHRNVTTNNMASNGLTAKVEHQPVAVSASTMSGQMPAAGLRPSSGVASGMGVMSGRPGSNLPMQPVTVKTEAVTTGTLSSLLHSNTNNNLSLPMQQLPSSGAVPSQDTLQSSFPSLTTSDAAQDFKVLGNIPASQPLRSVGATALPSNNLLVHSPSQSRHTIGSPSLPPSSPLSGLQPSGGGGPGSTIIPSAAGGSVSLSGTQSTLGINAQPGGVGMISNAGGLGVVQGGGVGAVHSGYSSGTTSLGGNTMMGSTQPSSAVSSGQVSVTALGGLNPSNQMVQNGLGLPGQSLMGVGNALGSSGTGTMMSTTGIPQAAGQPAHGVSNAGVPSSLHTTGTPPQQPAHSSVKYIRLWEGVLAGQRKGNVVPIPICKLEGYRQTSSPETLAADWPPTMQIMRLIPQEYMNQKDYQRKAELLVFRPTTPHDFLTQLAEKKLCAVIQLPSQTLLLAMASADKPGRMIGMLFPGDMVLIKPQVSSQQQAASAGTAPQAAVPNNFSQNQLQGQLQNQLPNNQLPSQLPNQQPRSQLLPGPTNLHGAGFLP